MADEDQLIDESPLGPTQPEEDPLAAISLQDSVEALAKEPDLAQQLLHNFFEADALRMLDSHVKKIKKDDPGTEVFELVPLNSIDLLPAIKACATSIELNAGDPDLDIFMQSFEAVMNEDPAVSRYVIELLHDLDEERAAALKVIRNKELVSKHYLPRLRLLVWYHVFETLAEAQHPNGSDKPTDNGDDLEVSAA